MLAEVPVVNDGSEPVPEGPGILKADIRAFTDPQTEHPVLENVSFTLRPGQMLGICGPTGSGKSTILSLIQRHFDVSEGDIRFHDIPLPRLLLDDWRSRLAVVEPDAVFVFRHHCQQYCARVSDGDTGPDSSTWRVWPASTRIFCACRRATTRKWVSGALCSPADKNSVSHRPRATAGR